MAKLVNGILFHEERYDGPDQPFKVGMTETPTMGCGHCQAIVILNPKRKRDRGWCWNCDQYLCDACQEIKNSVGCLSKQQRIDLALANPTRDVSIGSMVPTRDTKQLAEETKSYPGIWLPGQGKD